MRPPLTTLLALALALPLAACGEDAARSTPSDEAMVVYIERFGELTEAIRGVEDEADAQAAIQQIEAVLDQLVAQVDEMMRRPDSERAAAMARHTSALQAAQIELARAQASLVGARPELAQQINDAMASLPKPSLK